jgi:hypothetical protein
MDEQTVLAMLGEDIVKNAKVVEHASVFALVAAYDRKVTRDEFMSIASSAMGLHSNLIRLALLNSISTHHLNNVLDAALITNTIAAAIDLAKEHQKNVADFMARVTECPTSADKIN